MAYICEGCSKFASVELQEPDNSDIQAELTPEDEPYVIGSVNLVPESLCCGMEVASATAEGEFGMEIKHKAGCPGDDVDFEVTLEATDRYDGKDGTPYRYRRHYYGAEVNAVAKCNGCEQADEHTETWEAQAGEFESY